MLRLNDSIRHHDPSVQRLLSVVEEACSLTTLVLAAWQVGRLLAVHLIEAVLAARGRQPSAWPSCPRCGVTLRSKGFATRQVMSLCGPIQWRRRIGRCPQGCAIAQVAPLDDALGYSHISGRAGNSSRWDVPWQCLCRLRPRRDCWAGTAVAWSAPEPCGVGCKRLATRLWSTSTQTWPLWRRGMSRRQSRWWLSERPCRWPWGPMASWCRFGRRRKPQGEIRWREIKVGVLARLGQHRTRTGHLVTRLHQRRLVAVLGDIEMLTPRLWLEALRQGIRRAPQVVWLSDGGGGYGACLKSSLPVMLRASWTFTTQRRTCGRARPPGSMDGLRRRVGGSGGHATACAMASLTGSWLTLPRPWRSRACPTPHGKLWRRCMPIWHDTAIILTIRSTRTLDCLWGVAWSRVRANGSSNNVSKGSGCAGVKMGSTIFYISGSRGSTDA